MIDELLGSRSWVHRAIQAGEVGFHLFAVSLTGPEWFSELSLVSYLCYSIRHSSKCQAKTAHTRSVRRWNSGPGTGQERIFTRPQP